MVLLVKMIRENMLYWLCSGGEMAIMVVIHFVELDPWN